MLDDHDDWLTTIELMLDGIVGVEYEVCVVNNGADARLLLRDQQFDVALIDMMLGQDLGTIVIREAIGAALNTATVLMTAQTPSVNLEMQAVMNGATDVVYKPDLSESELRRVLHVACLRKRSEKRLREAVIRDGLTGVFNRKQLNLCMDVELERHARSGDHCSYVFIDLDDFKKVNDQFGHAAGDRLLQYVGGIGLKSARITDCFARYGGDEFGCLLSQTGLDGAMRFAEKVITRLEAFVDEQIDQNYLRASIGVASTEQGLTSRDELISAADSSLYDAKRSGKNQVSAWVPMRSVS